MFFDVPEQLGYGALGAFVIGESAGLPFPSEAALVAAGLLAHEGQLDLTLVIVVAAVCAVIGDNIGYLIGRRGGRAVLLKGGPFSKSRHKAVAKGEDWFARRGGLTVVIARWIAGVRMVSSLLAGASKMPWGKFLFFNVIGAAMWATTVAGLAAWTGPVVTSAVYGGSLVLAGVFAFWATGRAWISARRSGGAGASGADGVTASAVEADAPVHREAGGPADVPVPVHGAVGDAADAVPRTYPPEQHEETDAAPPSAVTAPPTL